MGLLNFSNIEAVRNMDCCGGVTRDELDSTRDEPPHKLKGCLPHTKLEGLDEYRWEWESPCTGSSSPNCCKGGGECIETELGGYCKTEDGQDDYKYCDKGDGVEEVEYTIGGDNKACDKLEKDRINIYCPGIDLRKAFADGSIKAAEVNKIYNLIKNKGGDIIPDVDKNNITDKVKLKKEKAKVIKKRLEYIIKYNEKIYTEDGILLNKNDPLYGKRPLSRDCKANAGKVCKKGHYYYNNDCNYMPKLTDPNIDDFGNIYTGLLILSILLIFIILILIFNYNKGTDSEMGKASNAADMAKELENA